MSHKTLVNGTVYEVGGGKTLIDGVAYSIDKGKTLVGGTAYEVGFSLPMVKVTLLADTFENNDYASAYIRYLTPDNEAGSLSAAGEYELPIGTSITGEIKLGEGTGNRMDACIIFNGKDLEYITNSESYSYTFTLAQNTTIDPFNANPNGVWLTITEE